jgi:choline-sulfatase
MEAAVRWLSEEARSVREPWVLCVNLIKPHFPHHTTREFWDLYPGRGDLPRRGPEEDSARHPYARDLRRHFETGAFTEEQIRGLRKGYWACVSFVDHCLGRLMDALEGAGLDGRTNVLYTSDHGEMLGKFGMWWKCSLYEDSSRIPCIAAGPEFQAGASVRTPVNLLDVQASIFSAAGVEYPAGWVGEPLQSLPRDDPDRVVFSEYHGHGTRAGSYMVRRGSWKLIHYSAGENQLFDLDEDPEELENLISVFPDRAAELEGELRRICSPEEENERARRFIRRQLEVVSSRGSS